MPITVESSNENMIQLILRDVLCVPNCKVKLLPENKAVNFGHRLIFNESKAKMVLDDGREINLTKNNDIFYLEVNEQNVVNPSTCHETKQTIKDDINLWHKRLRHLNTTNLQRSVGGEGDTIGTCDTYAMGKTR